MENSTISLPLRTRTWTTPELIQNPEPSITPIQDPEMQGIKRSHDGAKKENEDAETTSPFMPMFENFRNELDEHHDRRERIIKASRDITAASKKMYVSL